MSEARVGTAEVQLPEGTEACLGLACDYIETVRHVAAQTGVDAQQLLNLTLRQALVAEQQRAQAAELQRQQVASVEEKIGMPIDPVTVEPDVETPAPPSAEPASPPHVTVREPAQPVDTASVRPEPQALHILPGQTYAIQLDKEVYCQAPGLAAYERVLGAKGIIGAQLPLTMPTYRPEVSIDMTTITPEGSLCLTDLGLTHGYHRQAVYQAIACQRADRAAESWCRKHGKEIDSPEYERIWSSTKEQVLEYFRNRRENEIFATISQPFMAQNPIEVPRPITSLDYLTDPQTQGNTTSIYVDTSGNDLRLDCKPPAGTNPLTRLGRVGLFGDVLVVHTVDHQYGIGGIDPAQLPHLTVVADRPPVLLQDTNKDLITFAAINGLTTESLQRSYVSPTPGVVRPEISVPRTPRPASRPSEPVEVYEDEPRQADPRTAPSPLAGIAVPDPCAASISPVAREGLSRIQAWKERRAQEHAHDRARRVYGTPRR